MASHRFNHTSLFILHQEAEWQLFAIVIFGVAALTVGRCVLGPVVGGLGQHSRRGPHARLQVAVVSVLNVIHVRARLREYLGC